LAKRVYVGNLPFSSTEDDLRAAFSEHGAVAAIDVIADRETARPRGFAFVEMEDESAADAAISALDGNDFGGRNLRVSEAMERRGGGGGRGGRD
jgi:RNA recognition motif-containing protein